MRHERPWWFFSAHAESVCCASCRTCSAGTYETRACTNEGTNLDGLDRKCSDCPIGDYSSGGATSCAPCNNKPAGSSEYTSNGNAIDGCGHAWLVERAQAWARRGSPQSGGAASVRLGRPRAMVFAQVEVQCCLEQLLFTESSCLAFGHAKHASDSVFFI